MFTPIDENCEEDGDLSPDFWLDMCSPLKTSGEVVNLKLNPERNTGFGNINFDFRFFLNWILNFTEFKRDRVPNRTGRFKSREVRFGHRPGTFPF